MIGLRTAAVTFDSLLMSNAIRTGVSGIDFGLMDMVRNGPPHMIASLYLLIP
jgi:hypothetical protein